MVASIVILTHDSFHRTRRVHVRQPQCPQIAVDVEFQNPLHLRRRARLSDVYRLVTFSRDVKKSMVL